MHLPSSSRTRFNPSDDDDDSDDSDETESNPLQSALSRAVAFHVQQRREANKKREFSRVAARAAVDISSSRNVRAAVTASNSRTAGPAVDTSRSSNARPAVDASSSSGALMPVRWGKPTSFEMVPLLDSKKHKAWDEQLREEEVHREREDEARRERVREVRKARGANNTIRKKTK